MPLPLLEYLSCDRPEFVALTGGIALTLINFGCQILDRVA